MLKSVAITGATGFIGKTLLQKLSESNWKIRALTRSNQFDHPSIQWIHGDLHNFDALHQLIDGVEHVIHCAATVKGGTFEEFWHTNVQGTQNIVDLSLEQRPTPRLLLISSLAAKLPKLSWYAQSKNLSEFELIRRPGFEDWTIFRPTAVYGPGDKEIKPLFQMARRGFLPVVGKVHNRFGLIHVDDLVAAILAWLDSEKTVHGIFELDDGLTGGYSYQEVATLAQHTWGQNVRCIEIPDKLIRAMAYANLWCSRLLQYSPMLTPGKVNELQHNNWVCDNTALIRSLPAWRPRIRLQDVLSTVI